MLEDLPLSLQILVDSADQINQVTFFEQYENQEANIIQAVISPDSGILEIPWTVDTLGSYTIYTKVSIEDAGIFTSPSLTLNVVESIKEETDEQDQESE